MLLSIALPLLVTAVPALAGIHEVWWNISYVANANPDGLYERRVIGVNGTWPPPPIEINTNDSLVVHASNSLELPTTLHHHGMFFNSTSWMDGAQAVSQCGIPPGDSFTYVVPINSSGQHGTFWVHGHASGQYVDGLRAPVIIHPQKEVHKYDAEYVVILGDWYHDEHSVNLKKFIAITNPGGAEPVPESALIYFANGTKYLPPIAGTTPSPVTAAVGFNENATLPFQPNKTYRLRVINTSAFAMFFFWIEGHDMRIIEVDGIDVEEYPIDLIAVTVAQRYSVLVTARNDTQNGQFAIHANMDTDMFDVVPDGLLPNITSSITYGTGGTFPLDGTIDEYHDVPDIELVPSVKSTPPAATKTINLEFIFDTMDDGTNHAGFNGITWNPPLTPSTFTALTLGDNAVIPEVYGPQSWVVEYGDVVDLVIQNADAGKHPFHLHGHAPWIISRSTDYTSDDPTLNPPINDSLSNPMRRDVFQVPSGESITIRVIADNPGVWLLHCHIEWHLEVGLAIQFVEAPKLMQQRNASFPPILQQHCKKLGLPYQGNAAGRLDDVLNTDGIKTGPFLQILGWRPKGIAAMFGCVLSAVLGMATVIWYSLGGEVSEEEMEEEVRQHIAAKEQKGKLFGLIKRK